MDIEKLKEWEKELREIKALELNAEFLYELMNLSSLIDDLLKIGDIKKRNLFLKIKE